MPIGLDVRPIFYGVEGAIWEFIKKECLVDIVSQLNKKLMPAWSKKQREKDPNFHKQK